MVLRYSGSLFHGCMLSSVRLRRLQMLYNSTKQSRFGTSKFLQFLWNKKNMINWILKSIWIHFEWFWTARTIPKHQHLFGWYIHTENMVISWIINRIPHLSAKKIRNIPSLHVFREYSDTKVLLLFHAKSVILLSPPTLRKCTSSISSNSSIWKVWSIFVDRLLLCLLLENVQQGDILLMKWFFESSKKDQPIFCSCKETNQPNFRAKFSLEQHIQHISETQPVLIYNKQTQTIRNWMQN